LKVREPDRLADKVSLRHAQIPFYKRHVSLGTRPFCRRQLSPVPDPGNRAALDRVPDDLSHAVPSLRAMSAAVGSPAAISFAFGHGLTIGAPRVAVNLSNTA